MISAEKQDKTISTTCFCRVKKRSGIIKQMDFNVNLVAHNIVSILSTIIMFGAAFFTYLNGRKSLPNIMFALVLLCAGIFSLSQVIGVNISDPEVSRKVLMINVTTFLLGIVQMGATLSILGRFHRQRVLFWTVTTIGLGFIALFLIKPELMLVASEPKMYFPNYYEPGPLNWTRIAFVYGFVLPYSIFLTIRERRKTENVIDRKHYTYFMWTIGLGYGVAFIPNLLIFDIPVDPLWGMLFAVLCVIPFIYGAIKYGLFQIRVIAEQAFLYSIAVSGVGGLIIILNYVDDRIAVAYPNFPTWLIPLASALLAVSIAAMVWRRLRESDMLKYEFVTVATHKFRTPLTHVKWASENLLQSTLTPDQREQVGFIQNANNKLVELTNVLVGMSSSQMDYDYHMERGNIAALTREVAGSFTEEARAKGVLVEIAAPESVWASYDSVRMRFVLQTFIENAIQYSPEHTSVKVIVVPEKDHVTVTVTDMGIGISAKELPFVFTRFYRGDEAKRSDTEGLGIGLYISKQIVERHQGKIWVDSPGEGKGSTFGVSIPAAK